MAETSEIKLPGSGLHLDNKPEWKPGGPHERFPHAIIDFFASEGVTLRELRMLDFVNQITDKLEWTSKVHESKIIDGWRQDACGTEEQQQTSSDHLSQMCFEYASYVILLTHKELGGS